MIRCEPRIMSNLATLRRKNGCYGRARSGTRQSHSVRVLHFPSFLFCCRNSHLDALTAVIACQEPTNINQIISDHAQADPALHASITAITTAIQPVTPFEHTDTPLRPGSPLLSSPEGAFLLMATSFGALGRAVGHGDLLHSHHFQFALVRSRVERCIGGHHVGNTSELLLVLLQQRRVVSDSPPWTMTWAARSSWRRS